MQEAFVNGFLNEMQKTAKKKTEKEKYRERSEGAIGRGALVTGAPAAMFGALHGGRSKDIRGMIRGKGAHGGKPSILYEKRPAGKRIRGAIGGGIKGALLGAIPGMLAGHGIDYIAHGGPKPEKRKKKK